METDRVVELRGRGLGELLLLAEAALYLAFHRLRLAWLTADRGLGYLLRPVTPRHRRRSTDLDTLAWAVDAADRRLPGGGSCVERAASLTSMLRRRGVPARLRVGVARGGHRELSAHAWVETEGGSRGVGEGTAGAGGFVPLVDRAERLSTVRPPDP